MSERRGGFWITTRGSVVTEWLDLLGVLCDCENGFRTRRAIASDEPYLANCDRCTLIEIGGIRVRALKAHGFYESEGFTYTTMNLPAVEVTDEA